MQLREATPDNVATVSDYLSNTSNTMGVWSTLWNHKIRLTHHLIAKCGLCRAERGISEEVLARQVRLHLHRGIGYLAAPQSIRSIGDLLRLATEQHAVDP